MLFDRDAPVPPGLEDKLIRYYCRHPESGNDYCPNKGVKGLCSFHQNSDTASS